MWAEIKPGTWVNREHIARVTVLPGAVSDPTGTEQQYLLSILFAGGATELARFSAKKDRYEALCRLVPDARTEF